AVLATRDGQPAGSHPEAGDDAKQGPQGQHKSGAVGGQQIGDVPTKPGAARPPETIADANQTEDGAKGRGRGELGSRGTEDWPPRAISQTEKEGVEIEGPGDCAAGDQDQHENAKLGADDAERHAAKPPQTIRQYAEDQPSERTHEPHGAQDG